MSNWITKKIGDIGKVVGGATPSTKDENNYGGSISWITPKDLASYQDRYIFHGERSITQKGLDSCSTVMLPKGSILFSSRAPIGYVAIAAKEMCTNQGFKSIIPNETINPLFLFYLLKFNASNIAAKGSGTTFPEISAKIMESIEVSFPESIEGQKQIANFLDSIDSKIECNRKINDNLAEQLQLIYQHLIEDSKSIAISCTLRDISQFATGKRPVPSISVDTYYSTENMLPNKKGATVATSLPQMEQVTACNPGDTLVSNIRPYFKKIVYCSATAGCSADVLCLTPKSPEYSAFLYSLIYDDHFFDYVVSGSKGTKMPRGDKNQIMAYPVKLPNSNLLSRFNASAMPILERQEKSRQEIQALISLRDYLLPLLLNGQITIGG